MKLEVDNRDTTKPIVLTVESPTTEGVAFVESDDQDENVNIDNKQRRTKKSKSNGRKNSGISHRSGKGASRRGSNVSAGRKSNASVGRKSQVDRGRRKSELSIGRGSNSTVLKVESKSVPRPMAQRTYSSSIEDTGSRAEGRATPPELLAPIVVPRMSHEFNENVSESPALSNDSWVGDCAERFEDIEDDTSSALKWSAVGKEKIVHKADVPRTGDNNSDALFADSSTVKASIRSKRKSKPFLHAQVGFDDSVLPEAPDSSYSDLRLNPSPADVDIVSRTILSRQISAGAMSDDIQVVDTSDDVFRTPSPARKHVSGQRNQHEGLMHLPKATVGGKTPPGIMRRPSNNNKRKTVSFHDESPVIIEPNLRAPSRSLPREAMLSKSSSEAGEFKDALSAPQEMFSSLFGMDSFSIPATQTKSKTSVMYSLSEAPRAKNSEPSDIVDGANGSPHSAGATAQPKPAFASVPKTLDVPRSRMYRELSDSSGTEDSFRLRSSRRISRVSSKDKIAIREASKRQSKAVAQALSDQIRGVPKSAMLAFEENDVIISDDGVDFEEEDSDLSFRRRSRQSKVIRAPVIVPGQVPPPPPPPPFVPEAPRVRSVRRPPPPPGSPVNKLHE